MTTAKETKDPVLVILQLTGGNDYFNTVIPYNDPNYFDSRPKLAVPEGDVVHLDDTLGLHPSLAPLKAFYDRGDLAIVHGIGYANSPRSHFRSMDIWHTCEPDTVATEGWLGRVVRELDPDGENPITAVNVGHGLPRALASPGVSSASVADLSTYGLLTGIERAELRDQVLERFAAMYSPAIGRGPVMEYLAQTGLDAMRGADILKVAPERYSSEVEYGSNSIASRLRDIAMVHEADLGTRVFYTEHGGYDTHASQADMHPMLLANVAASITDFFDDLREHDVDDNVVMFVFSEFGRRVKDNGSGTDHGAAGVSFAIGPSVQGGMYSEYPDTSAGALEQGDLIPNLDFRGAYSTIAEDWLGLDPTPIVNGVFEKPEFIAPS